MDMINYLPYFIHEVQTKQYSSNKLSNLLKASGYHCDTWWLPSYK